MSHQSDPPILPLAEGSARHQPRKRVTFCEPEELPPFQRKRAEDETRRCVPTAATSAQTALVVSVVKEVQDMMNDVENDWDAPTTPRHDMQNRQALINAIAETLKEREHVGAVGFGNASGLGKTAVQVAVMEHFRDDCSPIYMSFGDSFRCDVVDDHLSIEFLGAWLEAGKLSTRWCSNTHGEDANTQQTNGGGIEVSPMVWEKAVAAFVAARRRFVCLPFEPLDDDAFYNVWKEGRGLPDVVEGRQGVHTLVGGSLRVLHALADTMDENDVELTTTVAFLASVMSGVGVTSDKNKIYLRSGLQDKLCCLQKRMLEGKKNLYVYPPGDSSFLMGLRLHSIRQHEHHSHPLSTVLGSFRMNNAAKALVDTCDSVHSGTVWMETLQHTMDGKECLVPDYSKLIQAHVDCSTFIISLENICSAPFDTHVLVRLRDRGWILLLFMGEVKRRRLWSTLTTGTSSGGILLSSPIDEMMKARKGLIEKINTHHVNEDNRAMMSCCVCQAWCHGEAEGTRTADSHDTDKEETTELGLDDAVDFPVFVAASSAAVWSLSAAD